MEKLAMIYFALTNRIAEITDKDRGATATEYALLITFVVILIAAAVLVFGNDLKDVFTTLGTKVSNLFAPPAA